LSFNINSIDNLNKTEKDDPIATGIFALQIGKAYNEMLQHYYEVRIARYSKAMEKIELIEKRFNKTIENTTVRAIRDKHASYKLLTSASKVWGAQLGLGISILQLTQSFSAFLKSFNQTDNHIRWARFADTVGAVSGLMTSARTMIQVNQLVGAAGKEVVEKGGSEAASLLNRKTTTEVVDKTVKKRLIIEGAEKVGIKFVGRGLAYLAAPGVGEILLVIDIAMIAWSIIEEANKDNNYQKWVKLAQLN